MLCLYVCHAHFQRWWRSSQALCWPKLFETRKNSEPEWPNKVSNFYRYITYLSPRSFSPSPTAWASCIHWRKEAHIMIIDKILLGSSNVSNSCHQPCDILVFLQQNLPTSYVYGTFRTFSVIMGAENSSFTRFMTQRTTARVNDRRCMCNGERLYFNGDSFLPVIRVWVFMMY